MNHRISCVLKFGLLIKANVRYFDRHFLLPLRLVLLIQIILRRCRWIFSYGLLKVDICGHYSRSTVFFILFVCGGKCCTLTLQRLFGLSWRVNPRRRVLVSRIEVRFERLSFPLAQHLVLLHLAYLNVYRLQWCCRLIILPLQLCCFLVIK